MTTSISISLYEALTTLSYFGYPDPTKKTVFNFDEFLDVGAELGIKNQRFFCDLNYFWNSQIQKPKFEPDGAILPYEYDPAKKSWEYGAPLNPGFQARISKLIKTGRLNKMKFLLCLATQGPDYGSPFFDKMGYGQNSVNYYDRANFDNYVKDGTWDRFRKYHSDIYDLANTAKARFQVFETYNEGDPGVEELQLLRPADAKIYQFIMPRPIPPNTKINVLRKVCHIDRFCFHGVYTPADVDAIVGDCSLFGIPPSEIAIATDGATPWYLGNGQWKYTTQSHQAHYKDRINWNKNAANKKAVIDAHCMIAARAKHFNIAQADFQSVLKWSQSLVWTNDAREWAAAILAA